MDRQIDTTDPFELNAQQQSQEHPTLSLQSPAPSDDDTTTPNLAGLQQPSSTNPAIHHNATTASTEVNRLNRVEIIVDSAPRSEADVQDIGEGKMEEEKEESVREIESCSSLNELNEQKWAEKVNKQYGLGVVQIDDESLENSNQIPTTPVVEKTYQHEPEIIAIDDEESNHVHVEPEVLEVIQVKQEMKVVQELVITGQGEEVRTEVEVVSVKTTTIVVENEHNNKMEFEAEKEENLAENILEDQVNELLDSANKQNQHILIEDELSIEVSRDEEQPEEKLAEIPETSVEPQQEIAREQENVQSEPMHLVEEQEIEEVNVEQREKMVEDNNQDISIELSNDEAVVEAEKPEMQEEVESRTPNDLEKTVETSQKMSTQKSLVSENISVEKPRPEDLMESPLKPRPLTLDVLLREHEKEINDITEEYERDMQVLSQQPTLLEVQQCLEELSQAELVEVEQKDLVERKVQTAVEWATNYLKALERNNGELGQVIEQIQTIGVRLDEMEKALEYRRQWKLWRLKVVSVNRRLENHREGNARVPYGEIKEIIAEEKMIKHVEPDDGMFQSVREAFEKTIELRFMLKETGSEQIEDLNQLVDIKDKLYDINVQIPETNSLEEKLMVNLDNNLDVDKQMTVEAEEDKKKTEMKKTAQEDMEFFMRIQRESERLAEWQEALQNFLSTNPEENIIRIIETSYPDAVNYVEKHEELTNIVTKTKHLENWHDYDLNTSADLSHEKKTIQRIARMSIWVANVLGMRQQLEEDKLPFKYENVKAVIEGMTELRLARDKGLGLMVEQWHERIEEVRRRYIRDYQQKRRVASNVEVANVKANDLIAQNIEKIDMSEAESVLELLKSIENLTSLREDVEIVTNDLRACQTWKARVAQTLNESETLVSNLQNGELNSIQVEEEALKILNESKTQLVTMPLRNSDTEKELVLLEWILQACFLFGNMRRDFGFEEWKKQLWEAEGLESEERVVRLKELILVELEKANKIKAFADRLRYVQEVTPFEGEQNHQETNNERKTTIEELSEVLKQCEQCRIPLKEEKRDLERVYGRWRNIKERVKKLLHPEKEKCVLREFTSLQEHLNKVPVKMMEEYKQLEEAIAFANELEAESRTQTWDNVENMDQMIEKYSKCPVYIHAIAKVAKTYDDVKQKHENVKSKEEALFDEKPTLTFDELTDLGAELEKMEAYNVGPKLATLKNRVFIKKTQLLHEQYLNGFERVTVIIPYTQLQAMLLEGQELKNHFGDDKELSKLTFFIESLLKEADKRLTDVEKEKDVEKLDSMHRVILRFVDISAQIIERKASLTCGDTQPQDMGYREIREIEHKDKEQSTIKKKGRPRKGEERTPKKEKRETSQEKRRKSKDKSREKHRGTPGEKTLKKLTGYYEPKKESEMANKPVIADNHPVLGAYKSVLSSFGETVKVNESDAMEFARAVIEAIPQTIVSKDMYTTIKTKLIKMMGYPYIVNSLVSKRFERGLLKSLLQKDDANLKNIEKGIKEKTPKKPVHDKSDDETTLRKESKKTVERDYSSQQKAKKDDIQISTPRFEVSSSQKKATMIEEPADYESFRYRSTGDKDSAFSGSSFAGDKKASVAHSNLMSTKKNLIFEDEKSRGSSTKKTPEYNVFKGFDSKTSELENLRPSDKRKTFTASYKDEREDSLSPKRWEKEDSSLHYKSKKDPYEQFKNRPVEPVVTYHVQTKVKAPNDPYDPEGDDKRRNNNKGNNGKKPYDPLGVPEPKSSKGLDRAERLERLEKKDVVKKYEKINEEKEVDRKSAIPEGTILRIFEGTFAYEKDKPNQKIAFFTCDDVKKVSKIPALGINGQPNLEVSMKLPKSKAEAYLSSIFSRQEDGAVTMISGWIESRISLYQSRCDHVAKDLLDNEQIATISYDEGSSRIIVMHRNQMLNQWKNKLNFRVRKVQNSSSPSLYFIITSKTNKLKRNTKLIEPAIELRTEQVSILGKEQTPRGGYNKEFDREDTLSGRSSIGDYEQDFGAEVNEKSSLGSPRNEGRAAPQRRGHSKNNGWADEDYRPRENGNKKGYKETKKRHVSFDVSEDEVSKKVKRDDPAGKKELIKRLRAMESSEIIEYAKSLAPEDRETIMRVLSTMDFDEEDSNEVSPNYTTTNQGGSMQIRSMNGPARQQNIGYEPPAAIQNIYGLFNNEQMNQAHTRVSTGPQYHSGSLYEPAIDYNLSGSYDSYHQEKPQPPEIFHSKVSLNLDQLNNMTYPNHPSSSIFQRKLDSWSMPQQQPRHFASQQPMMQEPVLQETEYMGKVTASRQNPMQLENTILRLERMQLKQSTPEKRSQSQEIQYAFSQMTNKHTPTNRFGGAMNNENRRPLHPNNHINNNQMGQNGKVQYKGVNMKGPMNSQMNRKPVMQGNKPRNNRMSAENEGAGEKDLIYGVKLQGQNLRIPKQVWEALSVLSANPVTQMIQGKSPMGKHQEFM